MNIPKTSDEQLNNLLVSFFRNKRKELGLNQTEVANSLGITQKALSHKETGKRKFTLSDFVRFSKRYAPDMIKFLLVLPIFFDILC